MEKKYPVLKCNEEFWNEIKPVLESFGITKFNSDFDNFENPNFNRYTFIVTNYDSYYSNIFKLGLVDNPTINNDNSLRYLVNTKEEFLSAVAKLLGKEYPIKEETKQFNGIVKYPYIKCTQKLYNRIKNILENVGYNTKCVDKITEVANELVINYANNFGYVANLIEDYVDSTNRYRCSNIREFLTKVCELKGFEVSYVDFVSNDDAENHYFRYILDKDNKTITIHETKEDKDECSATITLKKQCRKKNKIENYVVSCDPAIGESSTVVTTIPVKGNDFDKDKGSDLDIDKSMENINIADKLRHCKQGTKLYHLMFGEVEFDNLDKDDYINIITKDKENNFSDYTVNQFGQYCSSYPDGECLLFPSKDNRDWNSFQVLEEGHRVMVSDNAQNWSLRKYYKNNYVYLFSENKVTSNTWSYIVPVEDFDFTAEDITINKEKSII